MQQQAKLYIGNIPFETTSKELIAFFSSYGEVLEAMVIPDKNNPNKSKGFGFVTFASAEDAQKALQSNGVAFQGRSITVQIAKDPVVGGTQ